MISGKEGDDQGLWRKAQPKACQDETQSQLKRRQRQSYPRALTQLLINWDTTKLLQITSPKRQRGTKLWRKIQLTTKKVFLLVLWRR
jgi:hypothetical protein